MPAYPDRRLTELQGKRHAARFASAEPAGESDCKNPAAIPDAQRRLGKLCERGAEIAGLTDDQVAARIVVEVSSVSRLYAGLGTWPVISKFLDDPDLCAGYMDARARVSDDDGMRSETTIRVTHRKAAAR